MATGRWAELRLEPGRHHPEWVGVGQCRPEPHRTDDRGGLGSADIHQRRPGDCQQDGRLEHGLRIDALERREAPGVDECLYGQRQESRLQFDPCTQRVDSRGLRFRWRPGADVHQRRPGHAVSCFDPSCRRRLGPLYRGEGKQRSGRHPVQWADCGRPDLEGGTYPLADCPVAWGRSRRVIGPRGKLSVGSLGADRGCRCRGWSTGYLTYWKSGRG